MPGFSERHAIIVGGGASGVLLAYQLLRQGGAGLHVTLVEKSADIARGLAYRTDNPDHLLNVRAANMSALPDAPDHFWRWLNDRPADLPVDPTPFCFVSRRIYGDYLNDLVKPFLANHTEASRLTRRAGECVRINEASDCVTIGLADGTQIRGDVVILATGHEVAATQSHGQTETHIRTETTERDAVLILGTGLTMVDQVLSLRRGGHRGPIVAMSRRGLIPRAHRHIAPLSLRETDIPFGASIGALTRWIRLRIASHCAAGGDWRSVIDALRPFSQKLWRELPAQSRRRFLEHARAWWDVHRHRMSPDIERLIAQAMSEGQLILKAGKVVRIEDRANSTRVIYRPRGKTEHEYLDVSGIIDCTGFGSANLSANPALRSLLDQGLARPDPLRIGLDISENSAIIRADGTLSPRLFAVGPVTRAAFWEISAIPDIRNQCAKLAGDIANDLVQGRLSRRRPDQTGRYKSVCDPQTAP